MSEDIADYLGIVLLIRDTEQGLFNFNLDDIIDCIEKYKKEKPEHSEIVRKIIIRIDIKRKNSKIMNKELRIKFYKR